MLQHFRARPRFVSRGIDHGLTRSVGGRPRQRQKRCRCDRGFSSVQFMSPSSSGSTSTAVSTAGGKLRLTYLHVHVQNAESESSSSNICVFLTFEIAVITKLVECVQCSAPHESLAARIKSHLGQRCKDLSCYCPPTAADDDGPSASTSTPSLFLIAL